MVKKGRISSINGANARVTFPELESSVSAELPICAHVGSLNVNDEVIVIFWADNLCDGAIVGKVN